MGFTKCWSWEQGIRYGSRTLLITLIDEDMIFLEQTDSTFGIHEFLVFDLIEPVDRIKA